MELLERLKITFDASDSQTQHEFVMGHLDAFVQHCKVQTANRSIHILNDNHRLFHNIWEHRLPNHYFYNKGPQEYLEEMLEALIHAEYSEIDQQIVVQIPEEDIQNCSDIQKWAKIVCKEFFETLGIKAISKISSTNQS